MSDYILFWAHIPSKKSVALVLIKKTVNECIVPYCKLSIIVSITLIKTMTTITGAKQNHTIAGNYCCTKDRRESSYTRSTCKGIIPQTRL